MKNTGYNVDFKKETITITAAFRELAGVVNSKEYKVFRQLRNDYPDFKIKYAPKVNKTKQTHKGLTVAFMDNYIDYSDNRNEIIGGYNKVKAIYKGHPAYYAKVKKHFLSLFPELTAAEVAQEIEAEKAMTEYLEMEAAERARVNTNKNIQPTDSGDHAKGELDDAA